MMSDNSKVIEIRLSDIILFFRKYFWLFLGAGIMGCVGGYLLSYLYENEYKSTAVILPEYTASASSSLMLGDLAGLAGLMGRNRTEAIRPDLFPDILASYPFLIRVSSEKFTAPDGNKVNLVELLTTPEDSVEMFSDKQTVDDFSIISLSTFQHKFLKNVRSRISVDYGKLTGVINISVELPDPRIAAEVAGFSINYIKEFVTDYRSGKAAANVRQFEELVLSSKKSYHDSELKLNSFRDSNRNFFSNVSRVEEQRLETEFARTKNIYLDMAQKLEAAKLQLEENTPVLKVLDPPVIPYATSKPRRLIMAVGYGTLIGLLALMYVLFVKEKVHKMFELEID